MLRSNAALVAVLVLVPIAGAGCKKSSSTESGSEDTASSSAKTTAATIPSTPSTTTAAAPAAAGAVSTTGLTPAKMHENVKQLLFKEIQGEGLMYAFESGKLNGKQTYSAYIADDAQKTNSFQCELDHDPKIPAKTMVTFSGTFRSSAWVADCKIAKK